MIIQHNYLRHHRKRSRLTQEDISFIAGLPECSSVSRWEKGSRSPSIEGLLVYNLLFDTPVESLYERQRNEIAGLILPRIYERLEKVRQEAPDRRNDRRIAYLEAALTRLSEFGT